METLVTVLTTILVRIFGKQLEEFGNRITSEVRIAREQSNDGEPMGLVE